MRAPQLFPARRFGFLHLHAFETLGSLSHEPVLAERKPVTFGQRVREHVVGERTHPLDGSVAE